jgi:hypothetical protein
LIEFGNCPYAEAMSPNQKTTPKCNEIRLRMFGLFMNVDMPLRTGSYLNCLGVREGCFK